MPHDLGYDGNADSAASYECWCAWRRLRHEADEARRIGAMAERLAGIARRIFDLEERDDRISQNPNRVQTRSRYPS